MTDRVDQVFEEEMNAEPASSARQQVEPDDVVHHGEPGHVSAQDRHRQRHHQHANQDNQPCDKHSQHCTQHLKDVVLKSTWQNISSRV